MLDTNNWLYSSRTRFNDQTGHTIECTLYGKTVTTKDDKQHGIHAMYPKNFSDDFFIDDNSFTSSLQFKLS